MIETINSLAAVIFGITLLVIIKEVKKKDIQYVKSAMKNPLWPRTKLSTIFNFYKIYYNAKGTDFVIILNIVCFITVIFGLIFIILDY